MSSSSPFRKDIDSPSMQLHNEQRRHTFRNLAGASDSRRTDLDSPTRQLVDELARYYTYANRLRKKLLDEADAARKREHEEAIEVARLRHEEVRISAERVFEIFNLEQEKQRLERAQAEARALEAVRRANEELEARQKAEELESVRRREEHARKLLAQITEISERSAQTKLFEAQTVTAKKQVEDEATRASQESAQNKEQQRAAASPQHDATDTADEAQSTQTAKQATPLQSQHLATDTKAPSAPPLSEGYGGLYVTKRRLEDHRKYLEVHQRLKKMRQDMNAACKKAKSENPGSPLAQLQEVRRTVSKLVGQVVANNSENNLQVRSKILGILQEASRIEENPVDARGYIVDLPPNASEEPNFLVSGVLIYLLNIIVKRAVVAWVLSASTTAFNAADPFGVLLAAIFGNQELQWNGYSYADIVLAKFHASCPVLFGVYGPENKEGGRARLGWRKEAGEWIPTDKHYERMAGLGAGWASLTLRNFRKSSPLKNVFPPWRYWRSIAYLVNSPPDQVSSTHFIVLKAMLHQQYVRTFIRFYGQAGFLALRIAIVEFPKTVPNNEASQAVAVLKDTLQKDLKLDL